MRDGGDEEEERVGEIEGGGDEDEDRAGEMEKRGTHRDKEGVIVSGGE